MSPFDVVLLSPTPIMLTTAVHSNDVVTTRQKRRDGREINQEGAKPENAVTGTIFTVNAQRLDSLHIPASYSQLRIWRNTAAAELGLRGNGYTTWRGILGHEYVSVSQ